MSRFGKKFEDITFEDVKDLVDRKVPESETLDYKRQYTNNDDIANLISAFANTYGGVIVFGVSEEDKTNRPAGFSPLKLNEKDLDHKLDSICYDLISPPITNFQTKHLKASDDTRVFIVNVPESDLTPHAVENNTTVYVKVRSQKRKMSSSEYEKADLGTVEALKNRRQRYVELRRSLLKRMQGFTRIAIPLLPDDWYTLRLSVSPKYPRRPLADIGSFYNLVEGYRQNYHNDQPWSVIHRSQFHHYDGGVVLVYDKRCPENAPRPGEFQEFLLRINLHNLGLAEFFLTGQKYGEPTRDYLALSNITFELISFLDMAFRFHSIIGLYGSVMLHAEISGLHNTKLLHRNVSFTPHRGESICTLEGGIVLQDEVISGSADETMKNFACDFISHLIFVYNERNDTAAIADAVFSDAITNYKKH